MMNPRCPASPTAAVRGWLLVTQQLDGAIKCGHIFRRLRALVNSIHPGRSVTGIICESLHYCLELPLIRPVSCLRACSCPYILIDMGCTYCTGKPKTFPPSKPLSAQKPRGILRASKLDLKPCVSPDFSSSEAKDQPHSPRGTEDNHPVSRPSYTWGYRVSSWMSNIILRRFHQPRPSRSERRRISLLDPYCRDGSGVYLSIFPRVTLCWTTAIFSGTVTFKAQMNNKKSKL
jgi:hypothetical protein